MFKSLPIIAAFALLGFSAPAVAQDDAEDRPAGASLDAQLLDDLDSDLLEGLGDDLGELPPPPADSAPAGEEPPADRLDKDKLLNDLIDGDDIGAADVAADDDPRMRIEQKMRQVEQRLAQRDPSEGTQTLQRQIAEELAALLEQLQQQQQQNQNSQNSNSQQQQQSSSQQQNKQQKSSSNSANQPANQPAEDSEERLGKVDEDRIRPEDLRELFQRAWGHLPPQVRDQLPTGAEEKFLPKYEMLIEEYYRRLAEENRP